jgi:diaminohydroxyphosphoribosylaminopyrimidine deaminase/5-amino-6-(5-phosphoribosylamino)uracil reductase
MGVALAEAERARGRTRPNPMVGCVIVKGGRVVAQGYHRRAGGPHAERVALRRAGDAARGADVYVTLEPCNHTGRTGPCAEALVAAGVARVFIGARDPNPLVNGRGIRRLRQAGIEVQVGLCEDACHRLNEAFELAVVQRRVYVVAKMAQSLDGRVATRAGESQWITGPRARAVGHRLRNELDAILVGSGTVRADDPQLTCRVRGGRDPVRVILDSGARTSPSARVVRAARQSSAPTWIFVGRDAPARRRLALERAGAETLTCDARVRGLDLGQVVRALYERELLSVLVEGGPTVLGAFFEADLVDKVHAFVAPLLIGGEAARGSVGGRGPAGLGGATQLTGCQMQAVGRDWLVTGYVARDLRVRRADPAPRRPRGGRHPAAR